MGYECRVSGYGGKGEWGDVLPWLRIGENPGNRVMDILECVEACAGNPKQNSITAV